MLDRQILQTINGFSHPLLDSFFIATTATGGVLFLLSLTVALATIAALNRQWRTSFLLIAGMAGAALINILLKTWFERARPTLWESPVIETSYSFPSGHAMASMALAVILVILIWGYIQQRWLRGLLASLTAVYVLLVGFSRLYLGVHYPSDVVGGWIFGGLWVVFVWAIARYMMKKRA